MTRIAGISLVLLLAASLPAVFLKSPAASMRTSPEVQQYLDEATHLFNSTKYDKARSAYQTGLKQPHLTASERVALLIGIGSCDLMLQQYADALRVFLEADVLAQQHNFTTHRIMIANNRATLYRRVGDMKAALSAIEAVREPLLASRNPMYLTQAASLLRTSGGSAVPLFHAAIAAASEQGDALAEALAWQYLGSMFLQAGQLEQAEVALTAAFRLRWVRGGSQLQSCFYHLGKLRRLQGRFGEASVLLTHARDLSGKVGAHTPLPYVEFEFARNSLASGDVQGAFTHFERSIQSARELRLQLLPSETYRISAETNLQQIYSEYIQAGMARYRSTGDARLARRMLEISEEIRTTLFDSTLNRQRHLPPEYTTLLDKYQQALAASLHDSSVQNASELARIRVQLGDLESRRRAGMAQSNFSHQNQEKQSLRQTLPGLQKKLMSTDAVLSFHCGVRESYLWALTNNSFEAHQLPGRQEIEAGVAAYRAALMSRSSDAPRLGRLLREKLLAGLSRAVAEKPDWILSLDGPLFELPFGTLPLGNGTGYLSQSHSLRTVPGALVERVEPPQQAGNGFVAIADARYNSADPRWDGNSPRAAGQQLARLPGTAREAAACARAWGRDSSPSVLSGAAVNRASVFAVLEQQPAVFHVAAHVVPHPRDPEQVLIALGLQPTALNEYLSPAEIASARRPVGVVSLSGCGSASGAALPGLGLFGLTRAWLVSGATAVVATHWPMPDGSGEILAEMYRELGGYPGPVTGAGVAKALQSAQIRMLRSGDWQADPSYWGAFMVAGKE